MKYLKYVILLSFCMALSYAIFVYFYHDLDLDLNKLDLKDTDSLMIVAHADDETIWGGAHLLSDNYLVVCITCGTNRTRVREIKRAMKISNDQYISLWYPDKTLGTPDNWNDIEDYIYSDLEKIIKLKKWKTIVTHNPDGEYGQIHHIKTSKMVTQIYDDLKLNQKLYYFGKYYTKNQLKNVFKTLPIINKDSARIKIDEMIEVYKSQRFIKKRFNHMFLYENWQRKVKEVDHENI